MGSYDEESDIPDEWEESFQRMMRGVKGMPHGNPSKLQEIFSGLYNGTLDISEMPGPSGRNREISVPIQKLDKCGVCFQTTNLRLCNSCASAIYCSKECQRADWRGHKQFCSQTQQINLKVFYPLIAYLFDTLRRQTPKSVKSFPNNVDPYILSVYEGFGLRKEPRPLSHPALSQRIIRATMPGARKATDSENTLHHTVVLGDTYDLEISQIPDHRKLGNWWRGKSRADAMRFYLHLVRETDILEVTVAVSLLLLSEIYSTRMSKPRNTGDSDAPFSEWEPRSGYRLEFGHSPVSDFGICKGRIQGKANRVQIWTYYHPKPNTRKTVLDPDNHYWMYFRTIKGEEIILDCCSSAYGMTTCVDASHCLKTLPEVFRDWGSTRIPAYFHLSKDHEESHVLIEEKRFSVMQNKHLQGALGWEVFGAREESQNERLRQFMEEIQGRPCMPAQEERIHDFRNQGGIILDQILGGKCWKDWDKPTVHSRDESFDSGKLRMDLFMKGSKDDPEYKGKMSGLLGMFAEAAGASLN